MTTKQKHSPKQVSHCLACGSKMLVLYGANADTAALNPEGVKGLIEAMQLAIKRFEESAEVHKIAIHAEFARELRYALRKIKEG